MDYYASYKNSKDPSLLRKELVSYALKYGNKKAAQQFQTTVKTVRKWRKRWQEKKGAGLKDLSKNLPVFFAKALVCLSDAEPSSGSIHIVDKLRV